MYPENQHFRGNRGMDVVHYLSIRWLIEVIRKPGFWLILVLLLLITLPHYEEALEHPAFLTHLTANLDLTRHALERILYLAPIVWAGFMFSWRGAFITSLAALACMLPRAILISQYPIDALFETSAVFVIGNVLAFSFHALRKEREQRTQLEMVHQELRTSEERYRELFENALDAIWLHDMEGNIIAVNRSAEKVTGYNIEKLTKMNVRSFLSDESLNLAGQIRHKLLANEPVEQPYEQHLTKKDGSEIIVQLATSLVFDKGEPVAFQHIARDITEQKRMQENLRFYLRQATRAQEEERKRISRELHDETIQALVAHARQLDDLASDDKGSPKEKRLRLEELYQQTNSIMKGLRRLAQDLRPSSLDHLGLLPALEWLASDVGGYSGIATKVNVVGKERRLPEEVEIVLFRIIQEALRNVWRHSGATSAEIRVEFDENKTRVTVSDNGKGFNLPDKIGDLAKDGKLGLAGMQERAQLIGGALAVQSRPNKGTSISVELPA
jgi:two-component system sensor histidine kinase DegS